MIDWDNLVVGPCTGVFGEPVDYRSVAGGPLTGIIGVFDEGYFQPTMYDDTPVSTVQPTLGVQASQFGVFPPANNDQFQLIRTGQWYIVNNVKPDSHGAVRLMLNKSTAPS